VRLFVLLGIHDLLLSCFHFSFQLVISRDFPYGVLRRGLACLRIVRQAIRYRSATTAMQVTSDCVAIGCRRIRYCRSCRSGCRREIRPPMPSARGRHRIRDRQAALRRSSPAIRGTPASGGGRNRAEVGGYPIHPLCTASEPPSV
jgi:hypothetical protein